MLFSVLQGSCPGPELYNMYSNTLGKLIQGYLVSILDNADDKTLYDTFNLNIIGDKVSKRSNLEVYISRIAEWTCEKRLQLHNDRTKFSL